MGFKEQIEAITRPAVHLVSSERRGFTKIGGLPQVPTGFKWPTWKKKPLAFVMQVKLTEIGVKGILPEMPDAGYLYFFYDQEQSVWGFDPKDRGGFKVIYVQETVSAEPAERPKGLDVVYDEKHLAGKNIVTYPNYDDFCAEKIMESAAEEESDWLFDIQFDSYKDLPQHQIGGYARAEQNGDMERECALVTSNIYLGKAAGYRSRKAKKSEHKRNEWVLLAQIDSQQDSAAEHEFMWGDMGLLYFWIKKEDLARKDFDNVWMILQCG